MAILSAKQQRVWREADARWNVLVGAVRSGKTHVGYLLKARRMRQLPPGNCLLVGKTERTYARNVLDPMREMFGEELVSSVTGVGTVRLFGRKCYLVGANDERSVTKIQGLGLVYVDGDEFTTWPEGFFQMLKSRLSERGACADLTANPENPYHWAKQFIDSTPNLKSWHFTLEDNPYLPPEYVEAIKAEYTGLWYRRYILGLWVAAEGSVYEFDEDLHVVSELPKMLLYWVGIDYGTTNPTVALLAGWGVDKRLYVIDEHRYDPAEHGGRQRTDAQHSAAIRAWLASHKEARPRWVLVDPSAASFIVQLHQDGVPRLASAEQVGQYNVVLDGIRRTASLLGAGRLKIHKRCEGLIREMSGYSWDARGQARGEDIPLKQNEHGCDALRYIVNATRTTWTPWVRKAA